MERKYTSEMEIVIDNMTDIAQKRAYNGNKITPLHLLLTILCSPKSTSYEIISYKITTKVISKMKSICENALGSQMATEDVTNSSELSEIFKQSAIQSKARDSDVIGSEDVLLALIKTNQHVSEILSKFGITENYVSAFIPSKRVIIQDYPSQMENIENIEDMENFGFSPQFMPVESQENVLEKYTINVNEQVNEGVYDNVIGRDREVMQLIAILNRRNKNNALIIGDSGIGKTSLIYKLADMINRKVAPSTMSEKTILKLDIMALVSGTSLRGTLEKRIKTLFTKLTEREDIILFIDDMQSIVKTSSKEKDTDISGTLGEILNNGNVRVIGTIGYKDMKNGIESNPNLSNKFYKLNLSPMSKSETISALCENKHYYEDFHNISVSNDIIEKIVKYAERFITDTKLPNSAIDILDTIGAVSQIDDTEATKQINETDIKEAVSNITGLPTSNLSTDEMEKLKKIEYNIKKSVIGQDKAIETICNNIKRHSIGISDNSKPIAVSLLCGPTGVGKTLLAKKIAKEVFGNEKNIIRIDMSEFSEKSSLTKLIGTSAGYIGYESTNMLTDKVKSNPYSLILLDEIEKANDEIFNLLLQVFDEGRLTDGRGNTVSFKNCIILMTSNIGARENMEKVNNIGFTESATKNTEEIYSKALKSKFNPEFINRIDDIIYFNPLNENEIKKIIKLEMKYLSNRIKENMNITLSYDKNITDKFIYDNIKGEEEYGARPIKRFITSSIENKLVDRILTVGEKPKELELSYTKKNGLVIL